jgi:hypothetical protein
MLQCVTVLTTRVGAGWRERMQDEARPASTWESVQRDGVQLAPELHHPDQQQTAQRPAAMASLATVVGNSKRTTYDYYGSDFLTD